MAETGEETYYIVGESRTNVDNAITKVYGSFFIAFEVIPSTGEIIQTDCSRTLELTNDFIRDYSAAAKPPVRKNGNHDSGIRKPP